MIAFALLMIVGENARSVRTTIADNAEMRDCHSIDNHQPILYRTRSQLSLIILPIFLCQSKLTPLILGMCGSSLSILAIHSVFR